MVQIGSGSPEDQSKALAERLTFIEAELRVLKALGSRGDGYPGYRDITSTTDWRLAEVTAELVRVRSGLAELITLVKGVDGDSNSSGIRTLVARNRDILESQAQKLSELKAETSGLKTELKAEIGDVKAELKAEIRDVKAELKAEIRDVKAELKEVRQDIAGILKILSGQDFTKKTQDSGMNRRLTDGVILQVVAVAITGIVAFFAGKISG